MREERYADVNAGESIIFSQLLFDPELKTSALSHTKIKTSLVRLLYNFLSARCKLREETRI